MWTDRLVRVVDACRRHAWLVAAAAAVALPLLGAYTAFNLGIDTDTSKLFSPDLAWRQRQAEYVTAFPQARSSIQVVVEAATPVAAERSAQALRERLEQTGRFRAVWRPDGGAFFARHGLLFLPPDELAAIADKLIGAQALIGSLAADPSLRGLFEVMGLAVDGIDRGETSLAEVEPAFAAVAEAIDAALAGHPRTLSWQTLLTGRDPRARDTRRYIRVRPIVDFTALEPGYEGSSIIRAEAVALGLTPENGIRVRLTGSIPLADEEFASVAEGTGFAMIFTVIAVLVILYLAVGSARVIGAILLTLLAGLVATAAFAAAVVGALNLISVAFVVLFVGLAVDFGIQFGVRYRQERFENADPAEALRRCTSRIGGPLLLAAGAIAAGFFSMVPTGYAGIAELGLIAGVSMIVAAVLNLTLLPALLTLMRSPGASEPAGFPWAVSIDEWMVARRVWVVLLGGGLGGLAAIAAGFLVFDFNPLNLKDPRTESMATLLDILADDPGLAYEASILAPSVAEAVALASRLGALDEVGGVRTLMSFVPSEQEAKLAIIEDANLFLGPTLTPASVAERPDDRAVAAAMSAARDKLAALGAHSPSASARRLRQSLDSALADVPAARVRLETALIGGLEDQLTLLRQALSAGMVTMDDLPADLRNDWMTEDGHTRVAVTPKADPLGFDDLGQFIAAVRTVAPNVTGSAVTVFESGRAVVDAFLLAGVLAFLSVTVLLFAVLRRTIDVVLVVGPLFFAGVLTLGFSAVIGLPLNFANIIALPLLFGIGVAFNVYFVMNWRAGLDRPLQSPTSRAVLFSVLTTAAAFGSLGLSSHPGTASMGLLLAIECGFVLVTTFLLLPAVLSLLRR